MSCITLAFRAALAALLSVAAFGLAPAAQAQQISGVVVDCAGAPIGGASVDIYRVEGTDEEGTETLVASGSTNGAGRFGFTRLPTDTDYYAVVSCTCGRVFITDPFQLKTIARTLRFKCCHCGKCESTSTAGGQVYSLSRSGDPRARWMSGDRRPAGERKFIAPMVWITSRPTRANTGPTPPPCRGPRVPTHPDLRGWPRIGLGR